MTGILLTSAPAGVPGPGSLPVRPAALVAAAPPAELVAASRAGTHRGTGLPVAGRPRAGTAAGRPGIVPPLPVPVAQRFQNVPTLGLHPPGRPPS